MCFQPHVGKNFDELGIAQDLFDVFDVELFTSISESIVEPIFWGITS